jgi:DNA-directed RNA polymerase specialized sigma24 family protein
MFGLGSRVRIRNTVMRADTPANEDLLEAARNCDEAALDGLVERHRDRLERMVQHDREVLILRHFEELSNAETAQVLGIKPSAAVNRNVCALKRLKDVFEGMPRAIEGI